MRRKRTRHPVLVALYVNAALIAVLLVAVLTKDSGLQVIAPAYGQQAPQPIAGGAGLFLMPGQFSQSTWGCYVMDVDSQVLCAYEYFPGEKQLRLVAARDFRYDRKLQRFNSDQPTPNEVKDLVEKQNQPARGGAENK